MAKEAVDKIVKPFLDGKYSKVDREYVDKHFPDNPNHRLYGNGLVLRKHPAKKSYWESRIGVTLPTDAEVWPKPQEKNEIYGYVEDSNANPEVAQLTQEESDHHQVSDADLREALA